MTTSVVGVAERMLTLAGEMPPSKLQSLLILGQAASMHSLGKPLFDDEILAGADGPTIPALSELYEDAATVAPGFFYTKLAEQLVATSPESGTSVVDVAEHILAEQGEMTAMKLHKLVYYSQAWHLVWEGRQLFSEEIQAWVNGPVVPALYELHKGDFTVGPGYFYAKTRAAATAAATESDV